MISVVEKDLKDLFTTEDTEEKIETKVDKVLKGLRSYSVFNDFSV